MCDSKEIIQFGVQLVRAHVKNWIIIYRKNAISQEESIYSCHIQGDFPKNFVFAMVHIWFSVFMNTLPENNENWYTGWKNDADSKYDSQIALRTIPDYELF